MCLRDRALSAVGANLAICLARSSVGNQSSIAYKAFVGVVRFGIHTYIHYNLSVRIIDLVSHTTYPVRVYFIHKWRDLQFKIESERQF